MSIPKVQIAYLVFFSDAMENMDPLCLPYATEEAILKEVSSLKPGISVKHIYSLDVDGVVTEYKVVFDGRLRLQKNS